MKRVYFDDLVVERLENHPMFTFYSQQELDRAPKTIRRVADATDPRVANDPNAIQSLLVGFGEVLNRDGFFSAGGGAISIIGSTAADQPVYEPGYGYPAKSYIAMDVTPPQDKKPPGGRDKFWFKLPSVIQTDNFSPWFSPLSMESDQIEASERFPVFWKLTHGMDLPIYHVSSEAPRMRVMVLSHHVGHTDPVGDSLPALTTARLKYKTDNYAFVPKSAEAIPNCD